jgi:flagellar hook protein FlgE
MGLTSALFTGVTGLDANQTWLNVIGNNVANSNTTAFKSSMVQFSPQFYVTDQQSTAPTTDFGGTNPSQEGLGTSVASITQNFNDGQIQSTGVDTDMAINGSGFFIVKGPNQQLYTRDGAFTLNSSDQLVNSSGDFVQGYGVDSNQNIQSGTLQNLTIPLGETEIAKATQNATLQGNLDASGAPATGASVLLSQELTTVGGAAAPTSTTLLSDLASTTNSATPAFTAGQTITVGGTKGGRSLPSATFTVGANSTVQDLMTFFQQNMGIDASVPDTPPPGVTLQAGADPNTTQFVITGNTGTGNALDLSGTAITSSTGAAPLSFAGGTDAAGYTNDPTGESMFTSFTAYDSLGTPITVNLTAVLESTSTAGNTWRFYADSPQNAGGQLNVGSGTLTFGSDGSLTSSSGTTISISRAGTGATDPMTIDMNFGAMTQLSGQSSNQVVSTQDGFAAGTLNTFSVGTDGLITGAYSNGQTQVLGQVAVATFNNPQGLNNTGNNLYSAAPASGEPQLGTLGTLGAGTIQGSALEQSNVDLSTEFTNMIIASTGFSASSKVITTSDQLIQELLNSTH